MPVYKTDIELPRIGQLGGGRWHLNGLTDVTILFGKNGSGKSVLLRSLRDNHEGSSHYVAPERSGQLQFQAQWMQAELKWANRREASQRNLVPQYRERVVGRIQSYFLTRGGHRGDGPPPGDPADIEKLLSELIPDLEVTISSGDPPYQIRRVPADEIIGNVDQLSSGEAQLITLGLDILTMAGIWEIEGRETRLLLVDEPDAHIHPDLHVRFADFLLQCVERFHLQVVVATHSTTLLTALGQFGAERTSVVYMDRSLAVYSARPFDPVLKEAAACLGGHALMGPLFGAPLLLVEGDDDYRIWSQVPRHHVINLAVIPANGDEIKKYQKSLEQIFASLREPGETPAGFALLDGDKRLPEPSDHNPQRNIRFIGLNCHESENLYLTDEVLTDLRHDWESAKEAIIRNAGRFGNKREILEGAGSWDRRSVDLKTVIEELSQVLDEKNVHWTIRVGARVGRERPSGQLADFLGDTVLHALWGLPQREAVSSEGNGA